MVHPTLQQKLRLRKQAAPVLALLVLACLATPGASAATQPPCASPELPVFLRSLEFRVTVSPPTPGRCTYLVAIQDAATGGSIELNYVLPVKVIVAAGSMSHDCSSGSLAAAVGVLIGSELVFVTAHSLYGGMTKALDESAIWDVGCANEWVVGATVDGSGSCDDARGRLQVHTSTAIKDAPWNSFSGGGPCVEI